MDAAIAAHIRGLEDHLQKPAHCAVNNRKTKQMICGSLKFWAKKGFGFISPDGGSGEDHFIHASALEEAGIATPLQPGQRLSYDLVDDSRSGKQKAVNIKLID